MERLTKKYKDGSYGHITGSDWYNFEDDYDKLFNKLGALEDLQDELGIPLEVLFKALKEGVVFKRKHSGEICKCSAMLYLFNKTWYIDGEVRFCEAKLKDYSKTWALTREELENAKD
jgi:hypothetical protein